MRISGLGINLGSLNGLGSSTWPTSVPDSPTCGPNPCTWIDNTGSVVGEASQACADFMLCALPNDPTTIALNKSLLAGATTAVSQDVGNVVGDVASGVASGLTSGLSGNLSLPGVLLIGGLLIGGLLLMRR